MLNSTLATPYLFATANVKYAPVAFAENLILETDAQDDAGDTGTCTKEPVLPWKILWARYWLFWLLSDSMTTLLLALAETPPPLSTQQRQQLLAKAISCHDHRFVNFLSGTLHC